MQGDIRDADAVRLSAIRAHHVEAVLHFAASAYVGESVDRPTEILREQRRRTLSLLNAMLEAGCRKLVFSSSCAIYGEPAEIPIRETTPYNPVNPYGASKAMVERILCDYRAPMRISAIALRYFNASGADPEGELGELRDPETHLIPRAMMAIQGHIHDFAVFGNDYDTPDGTAIRDYIHVSDLADAHVAALRRLLAGGAGGASISAPVAATQSSKCSTPSLPRLASAYRFQLPPGAKATHLCWSPMPLKAIGNSASHRDCLI